MVVCDSQNDYNGNNLALRIASIFIILFVSLLGSIVPLLLYQHFKRLDYTFYILKNVGTGVIICTGVIHLLVEGDVALSEPCLGTPFIDYPVSEALVMFGIIIIYLIHLVSYPLKKIEDKQDVETLHEVNEEIRNIMVLEFGILFHSVIIGLSLAISVEFIPLLIAIIFHQFFEGIGLGSRFASYPNNSDCSVTTDTSTVKSNVKLKQLVPYLLSIAYSLSTPLGIAIGLALKDTYDPGSKVGLIVVGVFDSICAGILIYSGIRLFNDVKDWYGFAGIVIGVIIMGIIGYWA